MKKLLYFFPLNPADRNSGSISRALSLLLYFKERNCSVDFLSKHKWGNYTPATIAAFEAAGLADKLWVLRRKPVKKNPLAYFFTYKWKHLLFDYRLHHPKRSFPNHTTLHLRNQLDQILQQQSYDYIIISYAYWADLVRNNKHIGKAVTIIDTHDLLSSQHQSDPGFDIGIALKDEIRRISQFDEVWAISAQETYFFRQFFGEKVHYIPMMMKEPPPPSLQPAERNFDLIYAATDNPHNLASSKWFFEKVYPLLSPQLKICVIGTILDHIPRLPNISGIPFTENIGDYYNQSRLAICPMLSGTGVKIKVVEAMAYGLPVVGTEAATDGLPDRHNNGCLVSNDPVVFAQNIHALLADASLYRRHSDEGRNCFRNNFDVRVVYPALDRALKIVPHAED